eukprot:scaffold101112_cov45-Phaeocystis_antarctica.AAC.2
MRPLSSITELLSARVCLAGAVTLAAIFPRRPGMENPSKTDCRGLAVGPPSSRSAAGAAASCVSRALASAMSRLGVRPLPVGPARCASECGCASTAGLLPCTS